MEAANPQQQQQQQQQPPARPRNYVPTEALKRFADHLENDRSNPQFQKYLAANKERVHRFIGVPFEETIDVQKLSYKSAGLPDRSHIVAGLHKYPQSEFKAPISLQSSMEFQSCLGPKSRFGEGDGSFLDLWLTSDVMNSKRLYDKDGFPTKKHSPGPLMGFKRFGPAGAATLSTVKSYAERREERIRKELKEHDVKETPRLGKIEIVGSDLNDAFPPVLRSEDHKKSLPPTSGSRPSSKGADALIADVHGGHQVPTLTATDRVNYFGEKARAEFFDYYRHLSRQSFKTTVGNVEEMDFKAAKEKPKKGSKAAAVVNFVTSKQTSISSFKSFADISANIDQQYDEIVAAEKALDSLDLAMNYFETKSDQPKADLLTNESECQLPGFYVTEGSHASSGSLHQPMDSALKCIGSEGDSNVTVENRYSTKPAAINHIATAAKEKKEMNKLLEELEDILFTAPQPALQRPSSARRKFIVGCINEGIFPKPSTLIRKYESSVLDISSKFIGDKLAVILAKSLDNLPYIEAVNIAHNNLTDPGLYAIIEALAEKPTVTSLDISHNKVDDLASQALYDYITSPHCNLVRLIMANADIDDIETSRFIEAISQRGMITELDLSSNLLGSHEVQKLTNRSGEIMCGGEIIGAMLRNPKCPVKHLKLSWNKIHHGAIALVQSLKSNDSLTHLDLSFNQLGTEAGELLGDALHSHKHLVTLKVANNNIKPRACYTICSGIRSCRTLQKVDISDNPIGEVGSNAVSKLNLHYGGDIDIDISGCSVRLKDPTCWFNLLKLESAYRFDLSKPYERSCCIDLCRYIADAMHASINEFKITTTTSGSTTTQKLEFFKCKRQRHHRKSGLAIETDEMLASHIYSLSSTPELTKRLFQEWDTNGDGMLDANELVDFMQSLGVSEPQQLVEEVLAVYDVNKSGIIEAGEFAAFIGSLRDHIEKSSTENVSTGYLSLQQQERNSTVAKLAYPDEFLAPETGIVECSLKIRKSLKTSRAANAAKIATLVKASKTVTDGASMINNALDSMHLKYAEAQTLYRIMMKESGDRAQVLHKLLPRIESPSDAKVMVSNLISESLKDFYRLRTLLGYGYKVCIGLPNGYYSLNLALEVDRDCLEKLYSVSASLAHSRQVAELGDTSQQGDWLYFRNVCLDGSPFVLVEEWLLAVPKSGKLDFDFVAPVSHTVEEEKISNTRLCKIMEQLNIEPEAFMNSQRMGVLDDLDIQKSKGAGSRHFEIKKNYLDEASKHLDMMYDSCPTRSVCESSLFVNRNTLSVQELVSLKDGSTKASSAGSSTLTSTPASDLGLLEIMANHIRSLTAITAASASTNSIIADAESKNLRNVIANRLFDVLELVFSGRLLSCVQLAYLVQKFNFDKPFHDNKFISWRVELVVTLFGQISDLINFEHVVKVLQANEFAMILFRLGWLNVWNPLKPEGYIRLDLSRREERQVMRMVLGLAFIENGENIIDESFRPSRTADPEPGWNLSLAWVTEYGLPTEGVVELRYYSGEGLGLNDCIANVVVRVSFMAAVLALPYASETKLVSKLAVDKADAAMESHGIKLYLSAEKQLQNSIKPTGASSKATSTS